jgi:DNA-binding NarL/FixJ family response regulator
MAGLVLKLWMGASVQQSVIRVLIADDHPLFRQGIQALFFSEPGIEIVDEAVDGNDAIAKAERHRPDVALIDAAMPGMSSFEAARLIRRCSPETRILFLAVYDDEDCLRLAMEAGASGYLLKNSPPAQIVAAVRQVSRGMSDLTPGGLSRLVEDLQALARANLRSSRSILLTPREQEILKRFAEGGTARKIAADLQLSIKTVEAHKFNLMRKLDIHSRAELIGFAIQQHIVPAPVA